MYCSRSGLILNLVLQIITLKKLYLPSICLRYINWNDLCQVYSTVFDICLKNLPTNLRGQVNNIKWQSIVFIATFVAVLPAFVDDKRINKVRINLAKYLSPIFLVHKISALFNSLCSFKKNMFFMMILSYLEANYS